jgi:excisionase family DNA binding protein
MPSKRSLVQMVTGLDRRTVLQLLAHLDAQQAGLSVLRQLLMNRLGVLTSAPVVTTDQDDEGLLTADQVAKNLGLGRARTYELIRAGDIPSLKIGQRQVRVSRRDLTQYVQQARAS